MRRALSLLVIGGAALGSLAAGPADVLPDSPIPPSIIPEDPGYTPFPLEVCARLGILDTDRYCVYADDPTA